MRKIGVICAIILSFFIFQPAKAALTYDLGIGNSDISFSKEVIAGATVRIYATIHNYGTEDVEAYVTFYQGPNLVGDSQVVSVRAGGLADEVYVDWVFPDTSFNIRAEIRGQDPGDLNSANDVALSTYFVPKPDADKDGIPDDIDPDDDNDGLLDSQEAILGTSTTNTDTDNDSVNDKDDDFPTNKNETVDTDGDGIGDNVDPDDDNDNWTDYKENYEGTNPKKADTDGDGVIDSKDAYPLDPKRWAIVVAQNNALPNKDSIDTKPTTENKTVEVTNTEESVDTTDSTAAVDETSYTIDFLSNIVPEGKALINVKKLNWQKFIFSPEKRAILANIKGYHWDFGDGTYSDEKEPIHVFKKSGKYAVNLDIYLNDGKTVSSSTEINISFYNIANYRFWLAILIIFAVIIGGSVLLYKKSRASKIDSSWA